MNFGNPTPVFYEIVAVLLFGMLAAAIGVHAIIVFVGSMLISYVLFIASLGGFESNEAFSMGAGIGILIMIPVCGGAVLTTAIGYAIYRFRKRSQSNNKD